MKDLILIVEDNSELCSFMLKVVVDSFLNLREEQYADIKFSVFSHPDKVSEDQVRRTLILFVGMGFPLDTERAAVLIRAVKKAGGKVVATSGNPDNKKVALEVGADIFIIQPEGIAGKIRMFVEENI